MLYRYWPAVEAGTGCLVVTERHRHDGKDHVAHRAASTAALFGTYPSRRYDPAFGALERPAWCTREVPFCAVGVAQESLLCAGFRGAYSAWTRCWSNTICLRENRLIGSVLGATIEADRAARTADLSGGARP